MGRSKVVFTSKLVHHRGASLSEHPLLIYVLSWHTNLRICHCLLFHEHGKQNFVQPFLWSRKLLRYTHAWTKLHTDEVMSWISGAWASLCMALTWSELNYCAWFDDTVCEQPALICHGPQSHSADPSVRWGPLACSISSTCVNFVSVRSIQYMVGRTGHTRTRILQCSVASVGLAQARPNYYTPWLSNMLPAVVTTGSSILLSHIMQLVVEWVYIAAHLRWNGRGQRSKWNDSQWLRGLGYSRKTRKMSQEARHKLAQRKAMSSL